jgi:anaerobic ribonucleoside-triphosphate reductase activating protein
MNRADLWAASETILHLAQRSDNCTVLGPGCRAVLWVQGCPFHCPGCVAPETLPFEGGAVVEVDTLADELLTLPGIDGLTLSGGEPMAQPLALVRLIDRIRASRDLSVLSYTGYTLEHIRQSGTHSQRALLDRLDVLIDGPYVRERHTDLRWRGSDNQRVHYLTARHQELKGMENERGAWIEFELGGDGSLRWMGIPPVGFRESLPKALAEIGIDLRLEEGGCS